MGSDALTEPADATLLDPDEAEGLKLPWVATRVDLNAAESQNIIDAVTWLSGLRLRPDDVLDVEFLRRVHRRMFGDVWTWAGMLRSTERNIGIDPSQINFQMRLLLVDVPHWISDTGPHRWSNDEVAARFHHRLVWIHPFPNGNGRLGRLATDLLLRSMGEESFSWGRTGLDAVGGTRARYIAALRAADGGEFEDLRAFVRS